MSEQSTVTRSGYIFQTKIADTLQGCIWRAIHKPTKRRVVIKVADVKLHSESRGLVDGTHYRVDENILMEKAILKYLSTDEKCPESIVKYIDSFSSDRNYYLIMEYGGHSLQEFVIKAHKFIECGQLDISEWHRIVKIIFKQMMESVEYIHSKKCCHFDISLENFLINNVKIELQRDGKIRFVENRNGEGIQVKLCDFGLSEITNNPEFQSSKICGKTNYKSPEVSNRQKWFNSKSNDIWCLGVCLFMMIIGNSPWRSTLKSDVHFVEIMNGGIIHLLRKWNKLSYIDQHIQKLLKSFFKYEDNRITMEQIKRCKWLQS